MENIKELVAGLLIGAFFAFIIISTVQKEDELVNKHCSGLTGYEYGQCQSGIQ